MAVTAKVVCNSKLITGGGEHRQAVVKFSANSHRGVGNAHRVAMLEMTLRGDVADRFEPGRAYTLTFEPQA